MDDDFLSLMDDSGDTRDDLKCPDGEIGDQIREAIEKETDILVSLITYLIILNQWWIYYHRPVPNESEDISNWFLHSKILKSFVK